MDSSDTRRAATALPDGFYPVLRGLDRDALRESLAAKTGGDVLRALSTAVLKADDYLALLSPAAAPYLENMARRARDETVRMFGKTVQLFTPLYLANFCTNRCLYCGFNAGLSIDRHMLDLEEVEREAKAIAATGLRRLLVLTGDAPRKTGADYVARCVAVLSRYFSSIGIEIPSMTAEEYARIVAAGADSMTMFQETYNETLYAHLHPAGPKRDFVFRLDAPQRAVQGGMRSVNLGALLGLDDWRMDSFFTGLHASFLQERYPQVDVSVSFPRIRPCTGQGEDASPGNGVFVPQAVNDREFIQAMLALRCYIPQAGITLSTREPAALRDKLVPLGVTRMSAGVCTAVGGHASAEEGADTPPQFAISDPRSVDEVAQALEQLGYQAVYADWLFPGDGAAELSSGVRKGLENQSVWSGA